MRPLVRILLILLLLVSACTAWILLRPYDSDAAKDARWQILSITVKRDHQFYWVRCRLQCQPETPFPKSLTLMAKNRTVRSADYVRMGKTTDHVSFWVEQADLQDACHIKLDDCTMLLKNAGSFSLHDSQEKTFRSTNW